MYVANSPDNTNILDGEAEDLLLECSEYERKIKAAGGIDIFLGSMGEDGHLAFNEVRFLLYSCLHSR